MSAEAPLRPINEVCALAILMSREGVDVIRAVLRSDQGGRRRERRRVSRRFVERAPATIRRR
jgi:hypothetical protein